MIAEIECTQLRGDHRSPARPPSGRARFCERGHQKEKGAQLCAFDPYGRSTADGKPSAPVAHYFDKRQQVVRQLEGLVSAKRATKKRKGTPARAFDPYGRSTADGLPSAPVAHYFDKRQQVVRQLEGLVSAKRATKKRKGTPARAFDPYGRSTADGLPSAPVAHYFDKRQ